MKITRWDTNEVIFELECSSWRELVQGAIKAKISLYRANLRSADLRYANLESADLRYANLESADLRYANLRSADLRYANLRSADLRSANLRYAKLRYADLRYADLEYADLRYADLEYADLRSADLRYVNGNIKEVKSMQLDTYLISWDYQNNKLNIGCQSHTFDEWKEFTDEEISEMDNNALEWWNKWKDFIFQAIELAKDK